MTYPSSPPAPMTAERLAEVRTFIATLAKHPYPSAKVQSNLPTELLNHIDALTARVAELEHDLHQALKNGKVAADRLAETQDDLHAVESKLAAEAKLESARPPEDGELYKKIQDVLDIHSAWIARPSNDVTKAIAIVAGIWGSRYADAAEARAQAAEAKLLDWLLAIAGGRRASIGSEDNTYCPQLSRERVDAEIRALQTKDPRHD